MTAAQTPAIAPAVTAGQAGGLQPTQVKQEAGKAACIGKTAAGECVAWADGKELKGYEMGEECLQYSPTTEECEVWEYDVEGGSAAAEE